MNVHSACRALIYVAISGQGKKTGDTGMDTALHNENQAQSRIVAAARHLFSTRGFHQTAMADLAQEAKVSVGTIYRSFAGKADIIHVMVVDDTERMLLEIRDLMEQLRNGQATVRGVLTQLTLTQLTHDDEALSHEVLAEGHRNPIVAESIAGFCVEYRAVLRELAVLANPGLTPKELDGAEELLLACMFGLGHRNLSQPRLGGPETAELATQLILRALGIEDAR